MLFYLIFLLYYPRNLYNFQRVQKNYWFILPPQDYVFPSDISCRHLCVLEPDLILINLISQQQKEWQISRDHFTNCQSASSSWGKVIPKQTAFLLPTCTIFDIASSVQLLSKPHICRYSFHLQKIFFLLLRVGVGWILNQWRLLSGNSPDYYK